MLQQRQHRRRLAPIRSRSCATVIEPPVEMISRTIATAATYESLVKADVHR